MLTTVGLAIGVGGFVATTAVGSSASDQIRRDIDTLRSSSLEIQPATADPLAANRLLRAESEVRRLEGVTATGVRFQTPGPDGSQVPISLRRGEPTGDITLLSASANYLELVAATIDRPGADNDAGVALRDGDFLIGAGKATELGLTAESLPALVWAGSSLRTVTGIIATTEQDADLLVSAIEPATVSDSNNGSESNRLLIRVQPGWADAITQIGPVVVSPGGPEEFIALPNIEASRLRSQISASNNGLFLVISAVALILGSVVVCMTMLVAVLERTSEIGLRRAVGATRYAIATQFTCEAGIMGLLGGAVGTAAGAMVAAILALIRGWPSGLDPSVVLAGPLIGLIMGMLAGLYPALRATRVEPLAALR